MVAKPAGISPVLAELGMAGRKRRISHGRFRELSGPLPDKNRRNTNIREPTTAYFARGTAEGASNRDAIPRLVPAIYHLVQTGRGTGETMDRQPCQRPAKPTIGLFKKRKLATNRRFCAGRHAPLTMSSAAQPIGRLVEQPALHSALDDGAGGSTEPLQTSAPKCHPSADRTPIRAVWNREIPRFMVRPVKEGGDSWTASGRFAG